MRGFPPSYERGAGTSTPTNSQHRHAVMRRCPKTGRAPGSSPRAAHAQRAVRERRNLPVSSARRQILDNSTRQNRSTPALGVCEARFSPRESGAPTGPRERGQGLLTDRAAGDSPCRSSARRGFVCDTTAHPRVNAGQPSATFWVRAMTAPRPSMCATRAVQTHPRSPKGSGSRTPRRHVRGPRETQGPRTTTNRHCTH